MSNPFYMGIKLHFFIKDLPGHTDTEIVKEFPSDMSFLEVIRAILVILDQGITLDRIAVISDKKGIMSWEDVRNTVLNVMIAHRVKFTLVDRAKVFGPNLEDVETDQKAISPTIDLPVEMDDDIGRISDEIDVPPVTISKQEILRDEMQEEMALRKSDLAQLESFMEKEAEEDQDMAITVDAVKSMHIDKKKAIPEPKGAGGAMEHAPLPPPPGSPPSNISDTHGREILDAVMEEKGKRKKKKAQLRGGLSPALKSLYASEAPKTSEGQLSPPSGPPSSPPGAPAPVHKLARMPSPKPLPKPLPEDVPEPLPESPPAPAPSRDKIESFEIPSAPPRMKERSLLSDSFGEAASAPELEPKPTERLEMPVSTPASVLQTSKEYEKHLFVEYFDKMNPKKYYPMQVNLSDLEYLKTGSSENLVTGERQTQVKDKMQIELISSIITVSPMFPGCYVVPETIETDLNKKEDELTFYITPFVEDDLDDGCVEFRDVNGSVFHVVKTPSKVVDPRYSRVVAFYGVMISFFPKILAWLGFDFINEISVTFLAGEMALTNVIGVVGILATMIISLVVNFTRKPHSMKNEFTIGDIRKKISEKRVNTIPWASPQ
jgi:hypothetical protein